MKLGTLDSANAVYDCAHRAKTEVHHIDHAEFRSYCVSLSAFERSLGDMARDEYWRPFLRDLRRYRFDISSTPLPFQYPMDQTPNLIERLERYLVHCPSIFPQFAEQAYELINRVVDLHNSSYNPILTACAKLANLCEGNLAILIKEPRLIPVTEQLLSQELNNGMMQVISQSQLKGFFCYSNLVVIGPARWYEDYVFQSPRASHIYLVRYSWISDSYPPREVFTGSSNRSMLGTAATTKADGTNARESSLSPGSILDSEDFLPSINWDDVLRTVSARAEGDSRNTYDDEDYVTARLFQLEGEIVVPLDADEGSRATVLMLSEEESEAVRRIPVTDIEPGMFLLVRTGGGGEYIVTVADRILGKHSDRAREVQREWKDRLKRRVWNDSPPKVIRDLKRFGSKRANEVNIRNWMSYRSIKTEDPGDFRAIMKLVGLEDRIDDYWKTMTLIDSAHRKAGQFIRRQLLAEVRKADFQVLEKLGRMDFDLHRDAGVNLTALRIKNIHPHTLKINVTSLGHLLEMDGDTWQG